MKIGIYGYGNLARGVELAIRKAPDMTLCAVFTRRDPAQVRIATENVPVVPAEQIREWQGKLDVLMVCGGSATDLPQQTPMLASLFPVVDSFDNHARIPEHLAAVDAAAKAAGTTALISCGWDPGMFSLNRLYGSCILPDGEDYTFWGRGVSQGHSDAVRRIPGVLDARQYTVPVPEAMERVRRGERPTLTVREKHTRECYVVAAEGADREEIRRQIVTMPAYFSDYDTSVYFISAEEMARDHRELPHGGCVIRSGCTDEAGQHRQTIEYALQLDSNPEFTGSVLVAFARAVFRLSQRGDFGGKTVLDIAPADLSPLTREELIKKYL